MFKLKSIENNLEKTNINIDDQGRIGIKDIEPTAQLDINGTLRVRSLENQEFLKDKKPADLSPLVSDKEGNLFSLPNKDVNIPKDAYSLNFKEDHFVIPILRSGGRYLDKDNGLELEIKNLFGPSTYRKGRHLIEIKLLLDCGCSSGYSTYLIHYINEKLYEISALKSGVIKDVTQTNDKLLTLEDKRVTLEVVKDKLDQEDEDILIKYSPDANDDNKWIRINYFITSYFCI